MKNKQDLQLAFKDERDMIDFAKSIDNEDVCFYPAESVLAHRFLSALRGGGFAHRERPDFEDASSSLLLEAMAVDDHPRPGGKDKTRAREGQVLRELKDLGLDPQRSVKVFANVSSGLPTDQDHNYLAYRSHFQQTVSNHARKVEAYRAERPGFDLGFLILDESTAYIETRESFGPSRAGRPHFWPADEAFAETMTAADVDCFIWLTPYKRLAAIGMEKFPLPKVTVIDVALLRQGEHKRYNGRHMISFEE